MEVALYIVMGVGIVAAVITSINAWHTLTGVALGASGVAFIIQNWP